MRLLRDRAELRPLAPLTLKGKAGSVEAAVVVSVGAGHGDVPRPRSSAVDDRSRRSAWPTRKRSQMGHRCSRRCSAIPGSASLVCWTPSSLSSPARPSFGRRQPAAGEGPSLAPVVALLCPRSGRRPQRRRPTGWLSWSMTGRTLPLRGRPRARSSAWGDRARRSPPSAVRRSSRPSLLETQSSLFWTICTCESRPDRSGGRRRSLDERIGRAPVRGAVGSPRRQAIVGRGPQRAITITAGRSAPRSRELAAA